MVYNGVKFMQAAAQGKTEAEFVAHESHHGLSAAQLKEVYAMLSPKGKTRKTTVEKPVPVESAPGDDQSKEGE